MIEHFLRFTELRSIEVISIAAVGQVMYRFIFVIFIKNIYASFKIYKVMHQKNLQNTTVMQTDSTKI